MAGGAFKKGDPRAGRRKGVQNVLTMEVKAMIEGALRELGGQSWLVAQASENPVAFMALIGKLIPKDLNVNATHRFENMTDAELNQRIAALAAEVGAAAVARGTQATH